METGKNRHIDPSALSKARFDRLSTDEKVDLFVDGYRVPQKRSKAEALELLRSKLDQNSKEKPIRNLRIYWSAAASIVLIALLTTVYFYQSTPDQIVAAKGQHLEYALPDGSNITINADSKISFSESGFAKQRTLNLEGEAFFSVQKGKPFVVNTPTGTVEVLGTTLNVFSRDNELSVSCLTGKVKVTSSGQSVIIEPGEKADLVSGILKKSTNIQTDQMAGWRSGEFHFDNVPLISIFEEIERQFNVEIATKGLENRFFTGSFSNKNLNEVLETVCLPMHLDYEIKNGNKIKIVPKAQ
ncbi:anti-sigma factor [Aquipluma nitroreducens]|uniref:Anti-sigma factor n=1 Tax=Aquipluma nitroreducens TaxID=2010828 RepID=A0A5K7S5R8_9BACT|nr:FecR domain-containing protein [Aquipluma nitroreducens]BBE16847.1 anti-sigma factor [Aquipluma nitroreducens]